MVITHWDTDHYVGILKMLTNDLDVQLAAGVSGTSPLQVSFLKYDDAGNPLSVLYIPYEEDKEKNIPGKLDIVYSTVESKRIMGFKGDRKGNICKVVADMTKVAKTTLNGDPSELQSADSSNVIGRELFSGELVDGARSATSPQNLIDVYKAHGSFYKGDRPGLFCVAANNRYLPCGAVEKHTPHSYTNRSSIVCLIIRPPSTDLPNGAVSHYLAGDAESDLEAGVVKWTRLLPIPSRTTERPNIPDTVPIVKASHHGAPTSFPLNMCQTFKPSVILFSAGNKHRHPSWNILLYVYSYLVSWRGAHAAMQSDGLPLRPFYLTCFPYYFNSPDAKLVGTVVSAENPLLGTSDEDVEYRDTINDLFDATDVALDLVRDFISTGIRTEADQAVWLRDRLENVILQRFCILHDTTLPPVDARYTKKKNYTRHYTPFTPATQVLFVRIYSDDLVQGRWVEFLAPWPYALPPASVVVVEPPSIDDEEPPKKKKKGASTEPDTAPIMDGVKSRVTLISAPGSRSILSAATPLLHAQALEGGTRFYIMSSLVEAQNPSQSAAVATEWDAFVSALTPGYITLAESPSSESATAIQLDECDEWLAWFTSALSPSAENTEVQITVTATLVKDEVVIDHFDLIVPLPFASDKEVSLSFGPSHKIGYDVESSTFDPLNHFLRFDMSNKPSETITLADLLAFSHLSSDIIGFGSDLKFTLDGSKSAVWFSPLLENYSAAFRLQAVAQAGDWADTKSELQNILKGVGLDSVVPSSITVIVKRRMSKHITSEDTRCEKAPELGLSLAYPDFNAVMFCNPESYTFALRWPNGALNAAKNLLKAVGQSDLVSSFGDALDQISKTADILQISVQILRKDSGFKVTMVSVDAQVTLKLGKPSGESDGKDIVFMLTFVWPRMLFRGTLYTPEAPDQSWRKLMPDYEELVEVTPTMDSSKIRASLSILDLIPGVPITATPQGVPTEITEAMIEVNGSQISFSAFLESVSSPASDESHVPPITFDSLDLAAVYDWKSKAFSFSIAATVNLHPPPPTADPAGRPVPDCNDGCGFLFASVDYEKAKGWTLTGLLSDINFGDLLTFFHDDEQSQVRDILGVITIQSISLTYNYNTDGTPSNFDFVGDIVIAGIEFALKFSHSGTGWEVKAALGASAGCTLGDVLASICGEDAQSFELPDFVADINLDIPHDGDMPDNWEDSPIYLSCAQPSAPGSGLIFVLQIKLGNLRFTFLQLSYPKPKSGGTAKKPKRVLMFSFTYVLPSLQIPVVGKLDNPIDGLQFLWVHDPNTTSPGLTRNEVDKINSTAFPSAPGLFFKETKAKPSTTDVVLAAGCHFMLLVNDSGTLMAALDYTFKKNTSTETAVASSKIAKADKPTPSTSSSDVSSGGVSSAAVHKTVGPVSFANIGLQFKDEKLFIVFDATLALGPVGLSLLGFGIGAKITADFFTDFDVSNFALQLRGLAAALDKPPILLAGMFEDLSTPTAELFAGGVAIGLNLYSFLALGSYGVIEDDSKNSYKTFFVFGQLRGPLIELEFATINGVTLGFGYNSHLTYPDVNNILDFPLVKGISAESAEGAASASNVLTVLSDAVFKVWVVPQNGSYWFAAGLEVLAFETLDIRAVAAIEIDPYVSIGLFADAVCSCPPKAPRELCFAYVELGITCRVDIKNGTLAVEGKLSPNSFLLHPSCHLLGGFAMYYWFDPSPYAGDFVFSIGGYHPAYKPPAYYPGPDRLSISWKLDSHIGITGAAYFAVTPKACMGGGSLSIVFSAGPLSAHLDAHADFLMVWNPFHFIGDIGVEVGVSFEAKVWFVHVHISVDVGASLHLEGPPFGGNVHVNFYLFGFDIYFGSHPGPPSPLLLDEFWDLLARSSNQEDAGKDAGITLVVQDGYAPGTNKNVTPVPGEPWLVTGGKFKFLIQCRFALKTVQSQDEKGWTDVASSTLSVYAKPMHVTDEIISTLQVTVTKRETSAVESGFTFKPILKNVPSAQWGKYAEGEDPSRHPASDSMLDGSNSTLNGMLMGAMVTAPLPEYPDDHIPPYNAHDAMYVEVIKHEAFPDGDPSSEATSWLPKEAESFEQAAAAWSLPPTDPQCIVNALAEAFKWTEKLVGRGPELLLKNFQTVYLDIPSLTSA
ncbi:unnamed protein product [Somion occarium]